MILICLSIARIKLSGGMCPTSANVEFSLFATSEHVEARPTKPPQKSYNVVFIGQLSLRMHSSIANLAIGVNN